MFVRQKLNKTHLNRAPHAPFIHSAQSPNGSASSLEQRRLLWSSRSRDPVRSAWIQWRTHVSVI